MNNARNPLYASLVLGLLATACQTGNDAAIDRAAWDTDGESLGSDDSDQVALDGQAAAHEAAEALIPVGSEIGSIKRRSIEGRNLTFVKHVDEDGTIGTLIVEDGVEISEADVPEAGPRMIGRDLRALLDSRPGDAQYRGDDELVDVVVVLAEPQLPVPLETVQHGGATLDEDGRATVLVDGAAATVSELEADQQTRAGHIHARQAEQSEVRRDALRELSDRNPRLAGQARLVEAIDRAESSVTVQMPKGQIEAFLEANEDLVAGLELHVEPVDMIGTAMLDTNVDPWALDYPARHGEGVGIYMSESGCPDYGHISDYLRLSGSNHWHAENVSAILRGVSPDAYVYCRGGYTMPSATDLGGYFGLPEVHIENHSWAYGSDNEDYIWADRDWDNHIYDDLVAVFFANGNYGDNNGYTASPAKGLNVFSVGNYDDSVDTIFSDSSFLDSEIGNNKPELSAPGTSICAGGWCATGTSMASPHAAAFTADLMGQFSWLTFRPYLVKSFMLAAADKTIAGGTDKVGVGGLNFYRAYYSGSHNWWDGDNDSFSYFDSIDPLPGNGYVDREVTLNAASSNVRIALSWLNRGWYTYDHRNDAHPIGMDLDLCVFDPNGAFVGCSSSWDNPYEMVSFDPTVTGTYRVRISRYANRDTNSNIHMGLSIDPQ